MLSSWKPLVSAVSRNMMIPLKKRSSPGRFRQDNRCHHTVPEEGCDLGVYQVGKKFSNHKGILKSDDMTTESIVAKLMWILGQTDKPDEIARLFYREINHDRV